jgi:hypothetical protein
MHVTRSVYLISMGEGWEGQTTKPSSVCVFEEVTPFKSHEFFS